jgi:hypothetical protein
MRISEIESKMISNTEQMRLLQKQVAELSKSNNKLSELKESKLLDMFTDYIELGTIYNVSSYMYLTGVQTGVKDSFISPNFQDGDKIEFIKKNKKSFVIKCITKVVSKIETPSGYLCLTKITSVRKNHISHPDWIFRIDIMSLYNYMMRQSEFKTSFNSYVKRKESLELLGV